MTLGLKGGLIVFRVKWLICTACTIPHPAAIALAAHELHDGLDGKIRKRIKQIQKWLVCTGSWPMTIFSCRIVCVVKHSTLPPTTVLLMVFVLNELSFTVPCMFDRFSSRYIYMRSEQRGDRHVSQANNMCAPCRSSDITSPHTEH